MPARMATVNWSLQKFLGYIRPTSCPQDLERGSLAVTKTTGVDGFREAAAHWPPRPLASPQSRGQNGKYPRD